jgi:polyisoprenoid-binding protein YceI
MAWVIDPSHSEVTFSVRHLMISNVRGRFENFSGTVDCDAQRDAHLKSADFLNVEEYPYLTFKSKRVELIDENHAHLVGDLTIRGVTNEVILDVEYAGQSKTPWGSTSAGFSASTKINRKAWGLVWNVNLETGGVLVGDDVNINIELEIVKQAVTEAEQVAA